MQALELLFDSATGSALPLPEALAHLYGGALRLPERCLYANFVSTVDGVVALGDPAVSSGAAISGRSEADRFVMGLLRAIADVVIIGGGTLRDDPGHLWTADYIFPPARDAFGLLRKALKLDQRPLLAVVTASGELDSKEQALEHGALILTTERGASRLRGSLPADSRLEVLGEDRFTIADALAVLRREGHHRLLSEGGPHILAQLLDADLLDELFLTLSPVLSGRAPNVHRLGMVEGLAFPPQSLRWSQLLSVRRHEGHLLLRYGVKPTG